VRAAVQDTLDLIDFRWLVQSARNARAEQQNEQALDDYRRALPSARYIECSHAV
jgi:hypothetical protein